MVSGESVEAIAETLSETLVKLDISSKFSFRKKLELASMPKLQVLGKDLVPKTKCNLANLNENTYLRTRSTFLFVMSIFEI